MEVLGAEQGAGALAGAGREDGRVQQGEAVAVEEVADGLHQGVADAQDGPLALAAQPEVAVLHEELGAVLLGRDGEVRAAADEFQGLHQELGLTGLGVLLHHARHGDGGLLRELPGQLVALGIGLGGADDALHEARAVPQLDEAGLAGAGIADPAPQPDGLADLAGEESDFGEGLAGHGGSWA